MSWLDTMRAGANANIYNGSSGVVQDSDGRKYRATYSTGGFTADGTPDPGTLVGYVGSDGKPWYPGQIGTNYDLGGHIVSEFPVENPNGRSWFDIIPIIVLAAGTAGALGFLGPEAAFGAGGSLGAGGSVTAAASLGAGESLVPATGYSFGVNATAAELATGVHVSGAELAALNAGVAFTVPSVMAPAASLVPSASSASSLLPSAGTAASALSTASKALSVVGAALGLVPQAGAVPVGYPPGAGYPPAGSVTASANTNMLLWAGAGALALVLLKKG
jgi:hypothetical protein